MRRVLPLRTWMIGGIIALVLIPYLGTALLVVATSAFEPPATNLEHMLPDDPDLLALHRNVESQADRWPDPMWQADLEQRLAPMLLAVVIRAPNGADLYRSPVAQRGGVEMSYSPFRTAVVYQGADPSGEVAWHRVEAALSPARHRFLQMQNRIMWTGVALLIGGTIWGAVALGSRAVLAPVGALSHAAGQINRNELDFAVPSSSIRELNEFARAFDQMRHGLKESITSQATMEQERRLFIAAVAHDLRTPLSSIRGYLEGLRDGVARTPERIERYVNVALDKAERLERLIESFFAYSKTEYLNQPPAREPILLGALVLHAVEALQPQADALGIRLAMDDGPEPCRLLGDRLLLGRVIDNLLENALRHSAPGSTVTVGWRAGMTSGQFWVQDQGPGISPADLGRIFEPHVRADVARSSATGGAGLGLAIAKRLVEAHGGRITAENRGGARFSVTLPL